MDSTGSTGDKRYSPLPLSIVLVLMKKWWLYKIFVGLECETGRPQDRETYTTYRTLLEEKLTPLTEKELRGGYREWSKN